MYTYDGPLWALLTLRYRYLVARTHARARFLNYSQTTVAFCSNTPGGSDVLRVVSGVYIGIARGAQRGKLLLLFRGITLVATSVFPSKSRRPGSLSVSLSSTLILILILLIVFPAAYFAKYTRPAL